MITVQETTVWDIPTPNHKYIMSNDMRMAYAYIKQGETFPHIFNTPMMLDRSRRKFKVLIRTEDVDLVIREWKVKGSRGDTYTITLDDDVFSCTCPAATYRNKECKHIQSIKEPL
jgi:hypothetical protein